MIVLKENGVAVSPSEAVANSSRFTVAKVSRPLTYATHVTTSSHPITKEVISTEHKVYVDDITPEEIGDGVRVLRDLKFDETSFLVERHREEIELGLDTTLSPLEYQEVLQYRQELRDIPAQEGFPHEYQWPVSPTKV